VKVFLDVGAHIGETLSVVRGAEWAFDRIVCFEPAPGCWPALTMRPDPRVELCRFGLWHRNDRVLLYNPGHVGASMSADKDVVADATTCDFRDAAAWFQDNIDADDHVYAKINAEGAEADIVDRLARTGQLSKIDHLLIHFDIRKVPSLCVREPQMRRQLQDSGVEYQTADDIGFGGVRRGTRNWLKWTAADPLTRHFHYKTARRLGHEVRRRLYPLKTMARRGQSFVGHLGKKPSV
jgi:FkbM family methyltransferase